MTDLMGQSRVGHAGPLDRDHRRCPSFEGSAGGWALEILEVIHVQIGGCGAVTRTARDLSEELLLVGGERGGAVVVELQKPTRIGDDLDGALAYLDPRLRPDAVGTSDLSADVADRRFEIGGARAGVREGLSEENDVSRPHRNFVR